MNQQQAALIVRLNMTDADIAVMYPDADPKWYSLIREWGARGWEIQWGPGGTEYKTPYTEPSFLARCDNYRLASRTVTLSGPGGTFELPEPMRVAPEKGTRYWYVNLHSKDAAEAYQWQDDEVDKRLLYRGLCHATKEAAQQWADALSKVMGVQS